MKLLKLAEVEQQTLREMGIHHGHNRTRMRAQAILRLSQGLTLQQTPDEIMVYLNSVEQWRQRWNKLGLVGLYEGRHTGRPAKWSAEQQTALAELAEVECGLAGSLLREIEQNEDGTAISVWTAKRYLKQMHLHYKRSRYSFKKNATKQPLSAEVT